MRYTSKVVYLLVLSVALLSGCGLNNDHGELVGVPNRPIWQHPQPFGTVYIPTGTFHFGQSDQEVGSGFVHRNKQVSIQAFYMDDTEITNNEYRQFVYYVMDSILREKVGGEYLVNEGEEDQRLNMRKKFDEEDETVNEALEDMYYKASERFMKRKQIDVRRLIYKYEWEDLQAASRMTNRGYNNNRSDVIRKESRQIYPDTLVFIRDFAYSYNEPMTQMYFWHPNYDDYPVVGVNWHQANAFSHWRTRHLNQYVVDNGDLERTDFRLPTEHEWEYAARGGRDETMYPWGGPYIRNTKGCYLANFKPGRGNYIDDGGFYPVKASSYFPNDYGLYCMAGNVSEWTSSSYTESVNAVVDDMNPDFKYLAKDDEPETLKRKVIRGGSWKDIGYYIQNGSRLYEYQDTCKSFVGFRCVQSYMGRSNKDKP